MTSKATPARSGPDQSPVNSIRPLRQESFEAWLQRLLILVEKQRRLMPPNTIGDSPDEHNNTV